jgi:APA family basic amino acid/polyamine antiporter
LAEAAESIWGNSGAILVAVGACVSTFGTLNGFILLTGQVPLGAAQDGVFPVHFGNLSTRGTPAFGLIFSNALATLVIAMNYTKGLVGAR